MIQETLAVCCACGCGHTFPVAVAELTARCVVAITPRGHWLYFDRLTGEGMGGTRGRVRLSADDLPTLAPTEACA